MITGRKKKNKDGQQEECDENGLHKNKSLLEYQNKCLCTLIDKLKNEAEEKDKNLLIAEANIAQLTKVLIKIAQEIGEVNNSCQIAFAENNVELDIMDIEQKNFSSPSDIINSILSHEEINSDLECVNKLKENMKLLLRHLFALFKLNSNNLNTNFNTTTTTKELLESNEKLERQLFEYTQMSSKYINDIESLRSQNEICRTKLLELNETVEKLNTENFNLNRKVNSHPLMPYIHYEKKFFEKQIEEHKCVCLICAKEMGSSNEKTIEDKEKLADRPINLESSINEEEMYQLKIKENDALKLKINELYSKMGMLTNQSEFTEENVAKSKRFQSLIGQAEIILKKLESVKDENCELVRKNNSLMLNKENEISQISQKFTEEIDSLKKKGLDSIYIIEKDKKTILALENKIGYLENLLKAKDTNDIQSLYELFTEENVSLMKQMDAIKKQKKEFLNKYEDEVEKNKLNEHSLLKLKNENEDLRRIIQENNIQVDEKKRQYDYNNEIIKRKKEKIEFLKKENIRLQTDLAQANESNNKIIEMSEANEKGINELNKKIKDLTLELQESKQMQTKMTNEKLEDKELINLLKERKDTSEQRVTELQEQLENYVSYTKKIEFCLEEQKKLNALLQENIKINEKDIKELEAKNIESLKEIDKEKIINEDISTNLANSQSKYNKHLSDYDALKINYDELCKLKKCDPRIIKYEQVVKENKLLEEENSKYREMVHCKVCKLNLKDVVITKCFHTFCRSCVENTFDNRKRRCPICRELISQNDVKPIYLV